MLPQQLRCHSARMLTSLHAGRGCCAATAHTRSHCCVSFFGAKEEKVTQNSYCGRRIQPQASVCHARSGGPSWRDLTSPKPPSPRLPTKSRRTLSGAGSWSHIAVCLQGIFALPQHAHAHIAVCQQGLVVHKRWGTGLSEASPLGSSAALIQAEALIMGCRPNKATHALYCELAMLNRREEVRLGCLGAARN